MADNQYSPGEHLYTWGVFTWIRVSEGSVNYTKVPEWKIQLPIVILKSDMTVALKGHNATGLKFGQSRLPRQPLFKGDVKQEVVYV